jgi:hypothetical protein
MSSINRVRSLKEIRTRVIPGTVADAIEVGDLVGTSSGKVRSAAKYATTSGGSPGGRITTAQDDFADVFEGVAMTGKLAGETKDILVAVDCIAEYEVDAALGADKAVGLQVEIHATDNGTTATPANQTVSIGGTNPIGRLAAYGVTGQTLVTVHFMGKSVQAPVAAD